MSGTDSMISNLASLEKAMAAQAAAVNEMRKALGMSEIAVGKKAKKVRDPDAEKKPPTAWMTAIAETVADMRANGWPSWTDADGHVWPASTRAQVKDKSGAEHEAWVFPDSGKEATQAHGGMKRASFLKAQADPAHAAKAAKYRAELAEKRSADGGSQGSGEKAAPVADASDAGKKKGGRPKMSDEEKAAAKAKREAEKVGGGSAMAMSRERQDAVVASIAAQIAAPPPPPPKTIGAKKAAAAPKKPMDLSFIAWEHKGEKYFTNDRGDVVSEDFEWVGHFDGTQIDESAPEPEGLENAIMRE